jgi:hypothetical protein
MLLASSACQQKPFGAMSRCPTFFCGAPTAPPPSGRHAERSGPQPHPRCVPDEREKGLHGAPDLYGCD